MARREPHWVKLFLRELSRTGNVRVSAERAGVDFTSAYQRRKAHGEFAQAWEEALEAFAGRAEGAAVEIASGGCPAGSRDEELVIRPVELVSDNCPPGSRSAKLIRAGAGRWSMRRERAFLAALAETANVRRAAEAAGVSTTAVYARRVKHAEFAEAWEAALDTGKSRLEAMLVEAAQRRFDPDALPVSDQEPQVSVGEAIHIVKLKRSEPGRGPANGGGRAPRVATDAEVRVALAKRLRAFGVRVTKAMENGEPRRCRNCGAEIENEW